MFVKQAVGYINFRVIFLDKDESILVQNRYGSVSALQKAVEGIKSRKTRKIALGKVYDSDKILIDIEDICVAKEYGNYIKRIFGNHEKVVIRFGCNIYTVINENKKFDVIQNSSLALDYVESNDKLELDRLTTKKKYDAIFPRNRNTRAIQKNRETDYEKRLDKVSKYAKKHNLHFDKSSYSTVNDEIEWHCSVCDSTFSTSFKRLKDRKMPCKNCADILLKRDTVAVRNTKKYAIENDLEVDTSTYEKEKGEMSKLKWTCKHKASSTVSIKALKRRVKYYDKCPVCEYKIEG